MKMSIKLVFVIGFLLVSALAEEKIVEPEKLSQSEKVTKPEKVSEPEKESSAEAKAEVNLGDVKIEDKNVLEEIENTDNGLKASASASASFSFNFEEFLDKWFEAFQQNKESSDNLEEENKNDENNQDAEDNAKSPKTPSEEVNSPCFYSYAEEPQKDDDDVDGLQKNIPEQEQKSDVENVEVQKHCNQQNSEDREPLVDEPLVDIQSVEETQVEEIKQQ